MGLTTNKIVPDEGTPLEPGLLRSVLLKILAQTRVQGGHGIAVAELAGGGSSISLDAPRDDPIRAIVTAAPVYEPRPPADCSYTVAAVGSGMILENRLPTYGRPTRENEWMLWPARVGDVCYIVRTRDDAGEPTDHVWILTEAIAARPCG